MQFINQKTNDFEKINFNLKIHSKDRSLDEQKNPFNFSINFNPTGQYYFNIYNSEGEVTDYEKVNYSKYCITSKYEKIKTIKVTDMVIPSKIFTNDNGLKINYVKVIKTDTNKAKLFIENNMLTVSSEQNKITLTINKKEYILSSSNGKNLLIIKSNPYFIDNITPDGEITFTTAFVDNFQIAPLYLGLYNSHNKINISSNNLLDTSYSKLINKGSLLIDSSTNQIIEILSINNNIITKKIKFVGTGVSENTYYIVDKNYINTYNEKCFFLKFKEFKQIKDTSRDHNINDALSILYPYSDGTDYTILMGKGEINFLNNDLKNFNTLKLVLLDSRGNELGEVYNNFTEYNLLQDFNNIILNIEIILLKEKFK